jgi:copper(I)-binding protein
MQSNYLISTLVALALALPTLPAVAHDARIGSLHVFHPSAPATLPGQSSGAVYLMIENEGTVADRLLSASSPAASSVSIHSMSMDGNIMKMREVGNVALPPAAKVSLKADSGYHLMLSGLKQPLQPGDKIAMTLTFERAGKLEVSVHVDPNRAQKAASEKPASPAHSN